jgi:glycosyltransferase involved in cell wall biosynthesis
VVDNGSTDDTATVATRAGARVIVERHRGYGAACWAGVQALGAGVDVVAFLDGDGSQRPEELPRVLTPLLADEADLVLGARHGGGRHPMHALAGTRLVARLVGCRYGVRLTDLGPFRAIRLALLRRLGMRDRAFGWPKVSGTVTGSVRAGYAFLSTAVRAARDMS